MDFFENFFQKIWKDRRREKEAQVSTVHLNEIKLYLNVICQYILDASEIKEITGSQFYIGFVDDQLYLPRWIGWSASYNTNKNSYLYLALIACATKRLGMLSQNTTESRISKRMEFVRFYPHVNVYLDAAFSGYKEFQKKYLVELMESVDAAFSRSALIFSIWRQESQSRLGAVVPKIDLSLLKSNDQVPDFLQFSTVNLVMNSTCIQDDFSEEPLAHRKKGMTEYEKLQTSPVKKIELSKKEKELNPISHSFEKIETADDYSGGYRLDSGTDQLQDHLNALEDLEMSTVTTQGEAAQSFYASDFQSIVVARKNDDALIVKDQHLYPEWFSKEQAYRMNHCILLESYSHFQESSKIKNRVAEAYSAEIFFYKSELDRIVNQPTWVKRQQEGIELDLDECVRFQVDLANHSLSQVPKLFATKKKSQADISIFLLFDQSLSMDSWVDNIRIFNVIQDSLVMMGIIFEDIIQNVQIAGTWSATRKKCVFNLLKKQEDHWDAFYSRLQDTEPQGYTRLGPAIRHVKTYLKESSAKKKILIILTDGKPSDLDMYEGIHGVQDIKKACSEFEEEGGEVISILIDKSVKGYFSTMFKRYFIVTAPKKIFPCLFKILRELLK